MSEKKTLILIDGHALAFRQYYALERTNLSTEDGTPTWAVFGFFKAIFDLLKTEEIDTDAIAVAFDVSHQTFRLEKYKEYKANRSAMPDPMRIQMDLIMEGLDAFNIPVYTKEGYEADDVIGTIAKKACEAGHKVLILTGDYDAFQLIDKEGCTKVIIPSKGDLLTYDWDNVYKKMGVYPDQIVDYKALRGDTSDNIPGIYGIGEKTAVDLLSTYGTLENILSHSDEIKKPSLKTKIQEGEENAKISKFLATIVCDLDINFDFNKTCLELPDISKVTAFLQKMEFITFLKNFSSIMALFNNGKPCTQEDIIAHSASGDAQLQLNFFRDITEGNNDNAISLEIIQTKDQLKNMINELEKKTLIACHIEANIRDIISSRIYGIAFGYDNYIKFSNDKIVSKVDKSQSKIYYIPLEHSTISEQLSAKDVFASIKPLMENAEIKKTTHDVKTLCGLFRTNGVIPQGFVMDTLLASYDKNSSKKHDLSVQSLEYLGKTMTDYSKPDVKKRSTIYFVDVEFKLVKMYISDVITAILRLTKYWNKNLTPKERYLLNDIDIPVSIVLSDMEFVGTMIDKDLLNKTSFKLSSKIIALEREIYDLAGETFNLNSPRQVAKIIYEKLHLADRRKRTTDAAFLEELAKDHEICRLILEFRKLYKLKSVYVDGVADMINAKDHRVHTTFNLTNAVTGRVSTSNPNLQSIPAKAETGNSIRKAFVPGNPEKCVILSADYSQIELRILAHICEDPNLITAFQEGKDIHTLTASKVFDVPVSLVTKEMRKKAKAVNFGIIYGQTKFGLSKSLGIKFSDAEQFINRYMKTYPRVKKYMDSIVRKTERTGYCETIFGRRRYLAKELGSAITPVKEFAKRAAINFPIQGSGADLMKSAMIDCHKKLISAGLKSKMILQVHDELVLEVYKDELEQVREIVKTSMEYGQPFKVPLVVDINVGESWLD